VQHLARKRRVASHPNWSRASCGATVLFAFERRSPHDKPATRDPSAATVDVDIGLDLSRYEIKVRRSIATRTIGFRDEVAHSISCC
jgi:hypothetical protein